MSIEAVNDLVSRVRTSATDKTANTEQNRERVKKLAAEFESMLLLQMLKEMRKSGSWSDEEDEKANGFGSDTMLETIDVELASHLSKVKGFGLAQQLMTSLSRTMSKGEADANGLSGLGDANVPTALSVPALSVPAGVSVPAELIAPAPDASDALEMPEGVVTSAFGLRRDPIDGTAKFHRGIDIRAAYGQDIQTAGPGRVISAGQEGGYGETVVIEHAGGIRTRYAHLSMAMVTPGQEVAAGQVVGRAGRSGRATGTHLHFEVTTANGDRVDPAVFSRFKPEGVVADLTVGTTLTQETRRHDDTN